MRANPGLSSRFPCCCLLLWECVPWFFLKTETWIQKSHVVKVPPACYQFLDLVFLWCKCWSMITHIQWMNEKNLEDSIVELEAIRGNSWLPPISTSLDGFRVMLPERNIGHLQVVYFVVQPALLSLYLRSWFGVDLLIISIDIARFIAEAAPLGDVWRIRGPHSLYHIISYYLSFYHIWADDTRAVLIDDPTVPVYQYPMVINDTVST